jgi:hypothetical protein
MTWKANWEKSPPDWEADIRQSVSEYAAWYLQEAPMMWVAARKRAVDEAAEAMRTLNDFREVSVESLMGNPRVLSILRMAISPKMARDRFVEFVGLKKSLVLRMERDNALPKKQGEIGGELQRLCDFVTPLLDPQLFPWVSGARAPRPEEREKALLVLGDRRAGAIYDSALRQGQEEKQKVLMREFLESRGFEESFALAFEMPPGTFGFGRTVRIALPNGRQRNLPCDCVVSPLDPAMPLACVEMKSAGDYTNVNKRRKEEAEKHDALHRAYGDDVVFLLQLCGYFNVGYLDFEAHAGIDWAWDHRLSDLSAYFGI